MNCILYFKIKISLLMVNAQLKAAKKRVLFSVKSSRQTSDRMDGEYSRFLSIAEKREELYMQLIRVTKSKTARSVFDAPFDTGKISVSEQAEEKISAYDRMLALVHHRNGDWGEISVQDRADNNKSLQSGLGTVCSKYRFINGDAFWIETNLEKLKTQIRLECECV